MIAVHWMPEALARLDEIKAHIAQDAPVAADEMVRRILLRTRQLSTVPRSGRQVPDYQREDLRELLERPYRIIYRLTPQRIEILTVLHYRQLPPTQPDALIPPSA